MNQVIRMSMNKSLYERFKLCKTLQPGDVILLSPIKYKKDEEQLESAFWYAKAIQEHHSGLEVIVCVTSSKDGVDISAENFVNHYSKYGKIPNCCASGVKFC